VLFVLVTTSVSLEKAGAPNPDEPESENETSSLGPGSPNRTEPGWLCLVANAANSPETLDRGLSIPVIL